MSDAILVINSGSSSVKFAIYDSKSLAPLYRGAVDGIGTNIGLAATGPRERDLQRAMILKQDAGHEIVIVSLLEAIRKTFTDIKLAAAGHRIVHGGLLFAEPVLVDDSTRSMLAELIPLAPNHQPHNLAAVDAVAKVWPGLPQVACFDTAFHRTQPRLAQLFGLPRQFADEGILRYGFHGLSYEYISGVLPQIAGNRANGKVVVAHLGHGASMCAMHHLKSVATTMGFTTLDGLVMGTRCGTIDPGAILYLIQQKGMLASEVEAMLNNRSGLLGISGLSDDVRILEQSATPTAAEALELFAYRVARELGSLVAALAGLDILVFTAGIGEHSAALRRRICELSEWTGIVVDEAANLNNGPKISAASSPVYGFVIPTDEEIVIAHATRKLALGAV